MDRKFILIEVHPDEDHNEICSQIAEWLDHAGVMRHMMSVRGSGPTTARLAEVMGEGTQLADWQLESDFYRKD